LSGSCLTIRAWKPESVERVEFSQKGVETKAFPEEKGVKEELPC
jgi:hypothetical protein